jgi:hypothetical protein
VVKLARVPAHMRASRQSLVPYVADAQVAVARGASPVAADPLAGQYLGRAEKPFPLALRVAGSGIGTTDPVASTVVVRHDSEGRAMSAPSHLSRRPRCRGRTPSIEAGVAQV